ncbi:copper chaperone PCu(A)C [Paraglaciecola arctica]|uniref:copper chaperone PCu(A)C n=1 Tax=Paraglaciecola arctica TaxID=1128911 RepID=UPI001C069E4E|nr:copper chaperone PCu(A)C [Paraglaciecola arctica]MBU3005137.1 copper chaperone PCu(A)C [Paraglaciecola arctica]
MLRLIAFFCGFVTCVLHAEVIVSNATVRLLPPGVPNTAAYFSIENRSDSNLVLVAASADFASKAEIHNHVMVNNMMSMQQQSEVVIGPGESVQFSPGGLHIMLFGLKQALHEGQTLTFTLLTKTQKPITIEASVVSAIQPSAHKHH